MGRYNFWLRDHAQLRVKAADWQSSPPLQVVTSPAKSSWDSQELRIINNSAIVETQLYRWRWDTLMAVQIIRNFRCPKSSPYSKCLLSTLALLT
ncbi:hypothetical protein DPMN_098264 [Dreissena polymorpha]|uniref:Uncharacterized protein n=1 Tax=Dreissena polymorpha TaxID=45954 RepID=A0A9D4LD98_DREPO|nr:hypothetical protein DPMN_098264 [Dreissena polymorpha]